MDYDKFELGDVTLLSGEVLSSAFLAYKTYGKLDANKSNVVVLPTFYTGSHQRNEGFFGPGRAIDPDKHFVVSIDMFGNGSLPHQAILSHLRMAQGSLMFLSGIMLHASIGF